MHTVHNARVQLPATAFNNIAIGAVLAGIVAPMVRGDIEATETFVIWLIVGLDSIWLAYIILGRLRA